MAARLNIQLSQVVRAGACVLALAAWAMVAAASEPRQRVPGVDYDDKSVIVRLRPVGADVRGPGWTTIAERDALVRELVQACGLRLDASKCGEGSHPLYRVSLAAEMERTGKSEAELLGKYYGLSEWFVVWLDPDDPEMTVAEAMRRLERSPALAGRFEIETGPNYLHRVGWSSKPEGQRPGLQRPAQRPAATTAAGPSSAIAAEMKPESPSPAPPAKGAGSRWTPDDPYFVSGDQWGLNQVNAPAAWDVTHGDPDIVIAFIDTGIDFDHPDLDDKIVGGCLSFIGQACADQDGHGTEVAGVAAAETNNAIGVAGMCPNCQIMVIQVAADADIAPYSDVADSVVYAVGNGAAVINMSFSDGVGDYGQPPRPDHSLWDPVIQYARDNHVILVAAAGEDTACYNNCWTYPGGYDGVIAVTATTLGDALVDTPAFYPYVGTWVDVAAPGEWIWTTTMDPDPPYNWRDGTGLATAYVSGLAGLLKSLDHAYGMDNNNEMIEWLITATAQPIDPLNDPPFAGKLGSGRIDAAAAVNQWMDDFLNMRTHYKLVSVDLSDAPPGGNGNGIPEQGETLQLTPVLRNLSFYIDVQDLPVTLRQVGGVYEQTRLYDLAPESDAGPEAPFEYYVDPDTPAYAGLDFTLEAGDETFTLDGRWANMRIFPLPVGAPWAAQELPAIDGDLVVWMDSRNQTWWANPNNLDIWMYDLAADEETRITNDPGKQAQITPDVEGGRVVWADTRNGSITDIYMWDPEQGEIMVIIEQNEQICPKISGDWLIWKDQRDGENWQFYVYEISTATHTLVCDFGPDIEPTCPALDGDTFVWSDPRGGQHRLYKCTRDLNGAWLPFNGELILDPGDPYSAESQCDPDLEGTRVVWTNWVDVFLTDMAAPDPTQATRQVTSVVGEYEWNLLPRVWGHRVLSNHVRLDDEGWLHYDVYLYDLTLDEEVPLTSSVPYLDQGPVEVTWSGAFYPVVYGDRAVWTDLRADRFDLYVVEFAGPFGRADLNCDGAVNTFDIDPFVAALVDSGGAYEQYYAQYPGCNHMLADINCDAAVNTFDIDGFVTCLTAGCPPCP